MSEEVKPKFVPQSMSVTDEEVEEVFIDKKMIDGLIKKAKEEVLKDKAKKVLEDNALDDMIEAFENPTIEGFEVIDED